MKYVIHLAVFCILSLLPTHIFSSDLNNLEESMLLQKKAYIHIDHVRFADNRIFVRMDDGIYETPALYSDDNGYYIERAAKRGSCKWFEWECSNCQNCNLRGIDWECKSCSKPISD